jgi:hypothetical protein
MASVDVVVVVVAETLLKELIVHVVEHSNCCLVLMVDSFLLAD